MGYEEEVPFETLKGKTLIAISGAKVGSDEIVFTCSDGERFRMFHRQDCCESVSVEDVLGDIAKLIGEPLVYCYESASGQRPGDVPTPDYEPDSQTWTFYRMGTQSSGAVVLRWLGESSGYYSESVSFEKLVEG